MIFVKNFRCYVRTDGKRIVHDYRKKITEEAKWSKLKIVKPSENSIVAVKSQNDVRIMTFLSMDEKQEYEPNSLVYWVTPSLTSVRGIIFPMDEGIRHLVRDENHALFRSFDIYLNSYGLDQLLTHYYGVPHIMRHAVLEIQGKEKKVEETNLEDE